MSAEEASDSLCAGGDDASSFQLRMHRAGCYLDLVGGSPCGGKGTQGF